MSLIRKHVAVLQACACLALVNLICYVFQNCANAEIAAISVKKNVH